ncbi:uncharacterized protein BCR38DRAFT_419793 [Pseudomassariella vexata]|uniref:Uncharacterized protein n=1 Tax=Pseudomassariella vexata TaxID=1141098 RepID=A0A1Y2EDM3_9PEZI|nr:uncharacterized protein BCR38DRAFT_419793 [Pseudomassariella vexata]ORY69679.1 hypothetical protein BCR38DRAFT_419793 [Pseudomassariella vexata]
MTLTPIEHVWAWLKRYLSRECPELFILKKPAGYCTSYRPPDPVSILRNLKLRCS